MRKNVKEYIKSRIADDVAYYGEFRNFHEFRTTSSQFITSINNALEGEDIVFVSSELDALNYLYENCDFAGVFDEISEDGLISISDYIAYGMFFVSSLFSGLERIVNADVFKEQHIRCFC